MKLMSSSNCLADWLAACLRRPLTHHVQLHAGSSLHLDNGCIICHRHRISFIDPHILRWMRNLLNPEAPLSPSTAPDLLQLKCKHTHASVASTPPPLPFLFRTPLIFRSFINLSIPSHFLAASDSPNRAPTVAVCLCLSNFPPLDFKRVSKCHLPLLLL